MLDRGWCSLTVTQNTGHEAPPSLLFVFFIQFVLTFALLMAPRTAFLRYISYTNKVIKLEIEELDEEEVEGMPAGSIRIKGSRQAFVTVDDLADYYMRDATDDIPLQLTSPEELDEEEDDYGSLADPDSEL